MKVVFIGEDKRVVQIVALAVRLRWPEAMVVVAERALEGLALVERETPDIVLMRSDFEDMTLEKAIKELRSFSFVPLVVLGEPYDDREVVMSLEFGADDYIRLPCGITEVMTRIWALLRRARRGGSLIGAIGERLQSGPLLIDLAGHEVSLGGKKLRLTSIEIRLLHLLVRNWGMVVAHQTLERKLWGERGGSDNLAKKYIQHLREKLGDNARAPVWIANIHGVGYRFIGPPVTRHLDNSHSYSINGVER